MLLECCCGSADEVARAVAAGVERVELCSWADAAGCTPPPGALATAAGVLQELDPGNSIVLVAMLRPVPEMVPEGGVSFLRDAETLQRALAELERLVCEWRSSGRAMAALRIAWGSLQLAGFELRVCEEELAAVAAAALRAGVGITFHRAIDLCTNQILAVDRVLQCRSVDAILTSGGSRTALEGVDRLADMVESAMKARGSDGADIIIAGSGVCGDNAAEIVRRSGVRALHGTFRGPWRALGGPSGCDPSAWRHYCEAMHARVFGGRPDRVRDVPSAAVIATVRAQATVALLKRRPGD